MEVWGAKIKCCVFSVLLFLADCVWSLKCWHCIADNCEIDPNQNYKAVERTCASGQFCQKVFFEMFSTTDNRKYKSTVRGCAWSCLDQNDFINCTRDMFSSRGCIEKSCCLDRDFCNTASSCTGSANILIVLCVIFSIYLQLYKYR